MKRILIVFAFILLLGGLTPPIMIDTASSVNNAVQVEKPRFTVNLELAEFVISTPELVGDFVPPSGTPHSAIAIVGDADFASQATSEGWAGSGTSGDPYIIEGYIIDVGATHIGISINDTRVHFIVRNCSVWRAFSGEVGICLDNVTNGQLVSNYFLHNYMDISLLDSHGIRVASSNFTGNNDGVYGFRSNGTTFTDNYFRLCEYGIRLDYSNGTTVTGNTFVGNFECVTLDYSDGLSAFNNTFTGSTDGIEMEWGDNLVATHNTFTSCHDGFDLHLVNNASIANSTFQTCNDGVELWGNDSTIVHCTFTDCMDGIEVESGSNNTFTSHNTFIACGDGIYSYRTDYLTVSYSSFISCPDGLDNSIYDDHQMVSYCTFLDCADGIDGSPPGIIVEYCTFTGCKDGYDGNPDGGIIRYCTFTGCLDGIDFGSVVGSSIVNSSFTGNEIGINTYNVDLTLIANNTFSANWAGIWLYTECNDTSIVWNCFDANPGYIAMDNGTNNLFDYNYYSNYPGQ